MPKSFLLKRLPPQAEPCFSGNVTFSPVVRAPVNSEPPQLTLGPSESFAFYNFNFAPSTPYRPAVRAHQSTVHDLNNNCFEASPYGEMNCFLSPFHDAKFPAPPNAPQITGKNYHGRMQSSTTTAKEPHWGLRMGETLKPEMGERKGNLNKIQSVSSEKPPYKCDQCEKTFKTKYTLAIHLRMPSHTGARPFVCGICGKGFRLSSTLCRHKIIHTSAKPYKCSVCNKAFNRSSTLKTHMRTHSDVKEFLCQVCGKGFHQKGNLRNHVLIHTGEKPHKCKLCEKAFNKLSNLKFHMHVHTDNSPYRCRFCKVSFSRRCDLKIHVENVHHTVKE